MNTFLLFFMKSVYYFRSLTNFVYLIRCYFDEKAFYSFVFEPEKSFVVFIAMMPDEIDFRVVYI